jgi:uncharacterized protein YbbK (DUF523 family)
MKKKVIISACLLGEYCRYDGKTKKATKIIQSYKDYEIIPFCPEAPLFGTPREKIHIIKVGEENRVFIDETNIDVTELLKKEINSFIELNPKIDEILLKSKSPSCGVGTTPIYNIQKKVLYYGDGVVAKIFRNTYDSIDIKDERIYI